MRNTNFLVTVASTLFFLSGFAHAADAMKGMDMKNMDMAKPATEQAQATGVVKALDAKTSTVTIAHEPIKAFEWPSMTMKFKVADPALLKGIAVGDKVNFTLQGKDMMKSTVTALKITN